MTEEQRVSIKTEDGKHLACVVVEPPRQVARVLLLHGLSSGKNNKTNLALVPRLADERIGTIRFDFRGHYDSDGDMSETTVSQSAADSLLVLREINQKTPNIPIAGFGSSFGGAVLLELIGKAPFSALAFRSPVSDYVAMRAAQLGERGIRDWQANGIIELPGGSGKRLRSSFLEDARTLTPYERAKLFHGPVLIVHGTSDEEVEVGQSRRLQQAFGGANRLEEIAGADHAYSRQDDFDQLINLVTDFFVSELRDVDR